MTEGNDRKCFFTDFFPLLRHDAPGGSPGEADRHLAGFEVQAKDSGGKLAESVRGRELEPYNPRLFSLKDAVIAYLLDRDKMIFNVARQRAGGH